MPMLKIIIVPATAESMIVFLNQSPVGGRPGCTVKTIQKPAKNSKRLGESQQQRRISNTWNGFTGYRPSLGQLSEAPSARWRERRASQNRRVRLAGQRLTRGQILSALHRPHLGSDDGSMCPTPQNWLKSTVRSTNRNCACRNRPELFTLSHVAGCRLRVSTLH